MQARIDLYGGQGGGCDVLEPFSIPGAVQVDDGSTLSVSEVGFHPVRPAPELAARDQPEKVPHVKRVCLGNLVRLEEPSVSTSGATTRCGTIVEPPPFQPRVKRARARALSAL
jgi:hypothetical protein